MKNLITRNNILRSIVWGYFLLFYAWAISYFWVDNLPGIIKFITDLALYLFVILFFIAGVGLRKKSKKVVLVCLPGILLFFYFWGGLFLPKQRIETHRDSLRVMTININGWRSDYDNLLAVVAAESPDVIFIQELGNPVVKKIRKGLKKSHPYQIMEPQAGTTGLGVASRFPISEREVGFETSWIGVPQAINLDWDGMEIVLVNVHMAHTPVDGRLNDFDTHYSRREKEAQELIAYLEKLSQPVIVAGDINTTSLSTVYKQINTVLEDAWVEAGYGFGHSFPSAHKSSLYFIKKARIVPPWLVRIDYIFYSAEFNAVDAKMALFDRISDHRGVVTDLIIIQGEQ